MNWKEWLTPSAIISLFTIVIGIGVWYATVKDMEKDVAVNKVEIRAIQDRLRIIESDQVSIRKDIEFIKSNVSDIKQDLHLLLKRDGK